MFGPVNTQLITKIYASVAQQSVSLYDLKFLAMNENLVDRKQGVRLVNLWCEVWTKYIGIQNTLQFTKPHTTNTPNSTPFEKLG